MEQRTWGKGIRLFSAAVSLLFMALTVWLYYREDAYIKTMTLEIVPEQGRFQAEVLAEGRNVTVTSKDRDTKLYVERKTAEGKTGLLIHGTREDTNRSRPVSLLIVSDSDSPHETWRLTEAGYGIFLQEPLPWFSCALSSQTGKEKPMTGRQKPLPERFFICSVRIQPQKSHGKTAAPSFFSMKAGRS